MKMTTAMDTIMIIRPQSGLEAPHVHNRSINGTARQKCPFRRKARWIVISAKYGVLHRIKHRIRSFLYGFNNPVPGTYQIFPVLPAQYPMIFHRLTADVTVPLWSSAGGVGIGGYPGALNLRPPPERLNYFRGYGEL